MPKRLLRAFAVLASMLVLIACGAGEAREPPLPDAWSPPTLVLESFELPNGLAVDLLSGPCGQRAAVAVLFDVGTDHDPEGRSGLMLVLERVVASSGAQFEVGADHSVYSVPSTSDALLPTLDQVATRLASLEITEQLLTTARAAVLADIASRQGTDAALTAVTLAAEAVQPTRGNGRRGGIAAEVEAIQLGELQAFWREHFAQVDAHLVVTGSFDPAAARTRIERAFAAMPAGTAPTLREETRSTAIGTLVMGDAPTSIAIAVPAPAASEPLHPAFLVLAARLMATSQEPRGWAAHFDPITEPRALFVTGPVPAGEAPEPAAAIFRTQMQSLVDRPLASGDVAAAEERYGLLLGMHELEPTTCANDPRALAVAHGRRSQLSIDGATRTALAAVTEARLREAAALFAPARAPAVIAGGVIR